MRSSLLSAVALIALALGSCKSTNDPNTSQKGWVKGTTGTSEQLLGMTWVTPENGYIVGTKGTILHSTDGGSTWQVQTSGTSQNLYRVSFANANIGVAGGNQGTLVRTTDGGATWSVVSTDVFENTASGIENLRDLKFLDATHVVGVGGVGNSSAPVMQGFSIISSDAGATWSRMSFGGNVHTTGTVYSIGTVPGDAASFTLVGLADQALVTHNSGKSWFPASGFAGADIYGVDYISSEQGMAVTYQGRFYRTTDGGQTWRTGLSSTPFDPLRAIKMLSSTEAWVAGENGVILHTTDGGSSWKMQDVLANVSWNMIAARDASHVAFIGDAGQLWWRNN